jgi:tetraacyldisaccharide 4'-kinase
VGIGADRYAVGRRLLASDGGSHGRETPLDVLVLDDGFQHLQLERDLDLVLIDATDPFGRERMLPLGRLREPVSSLSRAGAILLTRTEPGQSYETLERRLRALNPGAPIFRCWTRPLAAVEVGTGSQLPLRAMAARKIAAFCGLGNPESFWRVLRREGLTVVARLAFRDHHRYSPGDLARIAAAAAERQADLILTTEKDLVNLASASNNSFSSLEEMEQVLGAAFPDRPLLWLKIEPVIEQGETLLRWIEERAAGRLGQPEPRSVAERARV